MDALMMISLVLALALIPIGTTYLYYISVLNITVAIALLFTATIIVIIIYKSYIATVVYTLPLLSVISKLANSSISLTNINISFLMALLATLIIPSVLIIRRTAADFMIARNFSVLIRNLKEKASCSYIIVETIFLVILSTLWLIAPYTPLLNSLIILDMKTQWETIVFYINIITGIIFIYPQLLYVGEARDLVELFPVLVLIPFSAFPAIARMLLINGDYEVGGLSTSEYCIAKAQGILNYEPINKISEYTRPKGFKWWFQKLGKNYCIELPFKKGSPHILITGSTGSGKTYTALQIIEKLLSAVKNNLSILIIDPHGEYSAALEKLAIKNNKLIVVHSINPLLPLGVTPRERAYQITEELQRTLSLGELQVSILIEAIIDSYLQKGYDLDKVYRLEDKYAPISFNDVIESLKERLKMEPHNTSIASLLRKIETSFRLDSLNISFDNIPHSLMKPSVIVMDLSPSPTYTQKYLYGETMLRLIYYSASSIHKVNPEHQLVVIIDEAHLFAPRSTRLQKPILVKSIQELRKYNVVFIVITQNITDLHDEIVNNAGYLIALRTIEPNNIDKTARVIMGSDDKEALQSIKFILSNLKRGDAIIKDPRLPLALLITFTK